MTKKAMVTGASEGIGREFAQQLSRLGYEVTGVARNAEKLGALAQELGATSKMLVADLSTAEGQQLAARELRGTHYDLLVNNAGVGVVSPFAQAELDRTLAMMHLNCDALVVLARAFLEQSRSGDALINVSSTLAFLPCPTLATYAGTKAFVLAFSEALWYEQKARGIYVQCLCPGLTSTQFQVHSGGRVEDVPGNLMQTPDRVVAASLGALAKRAGPTLVSGLKNRIGALVTRLLPRRVVVGIMGKAMMRQP